MTSFKSLRYQTSSDRVAHTDGDVEDALDNRVSRTDGIVIVDEPTAVTRPTAKIVLWLNNDDNAEPGDWRLV